MTMTRLWNTVAATMIVLSTLFCWLRSAAGAEPPPKPPAAAGIETRTAGMQPMRGFLPLYWDAKKGRLFLEITRLNTDMLYLESLSYGAGSSDLDLDRGQTTAARLVRFQRIGPKLLLLQPNQQFRSSAADPAEQLAARQSFPESVLAAFTVEAENPGSGGALLVDATEFFLRDAHDVLAALTKQGSYKLDKERSAIAVDATRAFPKNTEVESILTFAADAPEQDSHVAEVTPDAHTMTLREHHSFVELPGPGFQSRRFDPRAGYFMFGYRDYAAPLGTALDQRFILRHRLAKQDPACTDKCVALQPLQYYLDRAVPEPVRGALLEGARWWDQAFQAAGWAPGTFRVDLLPAGADPMDARYNIIQWVHRYTRGWSYGRPVFDPRTGEIIKGNVTLGSLRGRQDYLIAEALLSPYVSGAAPHGDDDPMLKMTLARLRQLAAHETGHTLGLAHNFAASSYPHAPNESVSVMDYPHPWIVLDKDGVPDVSQAYAANIGIWDKVAVNYGYRQFADAAAERSGLDGILRDASKSGLMFISDQDSRQPGTAHPHSSMWDNGPDPADELLRIMKIRVAALARFGENAIRMGAPLAQLEDTLAPLYLMHRYQTEAASKEIGGLDYRFELRGDGQPDPVIVAAAAQRKALRAVVTTLSPEMLTIPESLLKVLPPRPPGLDRTGESLPAFTGVTFDPVAAAESAADLTLASLFNPQRAARLIEYSARLPGVPTLDEVIETALSVNRPTRRQAPGAGLFGEVQSAVYMRTVEALLNLAGDSASSAAVRAVVFAKLDQIKQRADAGSVTDTYVTYRIDQFLEDPKKFAFAAPIPAPPGMPIGDIEE